MKKNLEVFKHNYSLLLQSVQTLKKSLSKCKKIGVKTEYSFEETESFDSLTSKFARTSDIYTQKVLRTILILLRENQNTYIDMANKRIKKIPELLFSVKIMKRLKSSWLRTELILLQLVHLFVFQFPLLLF